MRKLLILLLCLSLSRIALCADLNYLVDMRTAIMDELGISATTNFFTTTKLNRFANRGIKFVENATKTNQETFGFLLTAGRFRYQITDTTIAFNGVEFVYRLPLNAAIEPVALTYKPMNEFSLGEKVASTSIYSLWDSTVYISKPPTDDGSDSLFVLAWKTSFDLTADSSIVPLPRGWMRELAVLYALKLCAEAQQNENKATRLWNEWKEKWQIATGVPFKQSEPLNPTNP